MVAYSYKARFVAPIAVGLGIEIPRWPNLVIPAGLKILPKRQTIRALGLRRHARPGETLQLYYAMRTKQCRKIGDARCTSTHSLTIDVRDHSMSTRLDGAHISGGYLRDFAMSDGFAHAEDMLEFWKAEHGLGKFEGVLIRWEPLEKDG
jgi:hypothetical protein